MFIGWSGMLLRRELDQGKPENRGASMCQLNRRLVVLRHSIVAPCQRAGGAPSFGKSDLKGLLRSSRVFV
jgi:hypothetical protein